MTACYKDILQEKRPSFIKQSSRTCAAPPVLSNVGDDDPDNPPTDQEEMSSP
jgi:hypothetical protein